MKELNAISYFDIDNYELVINQIQDMDYKVYYIDGTKIFTMEDFFCLIKDILPLDPPLSGIVNFDAFEDSFSAGIDQSEYNKVALVFQRPEELMKQDRFDVLIECLEDITKQLMREDCYNHKLTTLRTLFFGKGKKFCDRKLR